MCINDESLGILNCLPHEFNYISQYQTWFNVTLIILWSCSRIGKHSWVEEEVRRGSEKLQEVLESTNLSLVMNMKKSRFMLANQNTGRIITNDFMDVSRHNIDLLNTSKVALCAVEGSLSKGFAGLFLTCSCHFRRERRVLLAPSYKASSAKNFFPSDII